MVEEPAAAASCRRQPLLLVPHVYRKEGSDEGDAPVDENDLLAVVVAVDDDGNEGISDDVESRLNQGVWTIVSSCFPPQKIRDRLLVSKVFRLMVGTTEFILRNMVKHAVLLLLCFSP
jgi:hypothetical protein